MPATCVPQYVPRANTGLSKHGDPVFPHFGRGTTTWPMFAQGGGGYNVPPHCPRAEGSGTPSMHCLTAWGQWAVQLLQCTTTPPRGGGQTNSYNAWAPQLGGRAVLQRRRPLPMECLRGAAAPIPTSWGDGDSCPGGGCCLCPRDLIGQPKLVCVGHSPPPPINFIAPPPPEFKCASMCISVLQCASVCFIVLQCASVCISVHQCASVCINVLQ